jgi:hypothetical protein
MVMTLESNLVGAAPNRKRRTSCWADSILPLAVVSLQRTVKTAKKVQTMHPQGALQLVREISLLILLQMQQRKFQSTIMGCGARQESERIRC